jgi:hypothetical protein
MTNTVRGYPAMTDEERIERLMTLANAIGGGSFADAYEDAATRIEQLLNALTEIEHAEHVEIARRIARAALSPDTIGGTNVSRD